MSYYRDSNNQNWGTPQWILDEIKQRHGDFWDACPYPQTWDALKKNWAPITYVNPPFNKIRDFCKKAFLEYQKGKTIIILLPTDRLYRNYLSEILEICSFEIIPHLVQFIPLENQKIAGKGFHLPICLLTLGGEIGRFRTLRKPK